MTSKSSAAPQKNAAHHSEETHLRHSGEFVERMFSGFGHMSERSLGRRGAAPPADTPYAPLRQLKASPGAMFRLQSQTSLLRVQASSPATDVMTDLTHVAAVTIAPEASIHDAHHRMITHSVRALFAVDEARSILGIITSSDLLGERPIQIAHARAVRHADVLVREVMTPANFLEMLELQDVLHARVGDIVETLKRSGRQHALVMESAPSDASAVIHTVRGIFSLTQIARQLGLAPQVTHDVARTFAEIEAAIGR